MDIHNKTILRFNRSTRMAHTPTSKPELGSIVRKQFCIALHASRCLNKHLTGAPSSYTPLLVLGPAPHDPRVHKPTIHKTRMTRVVNGVRHTTLRKPATTVPTLCSGQPPCCPDAASISGVHDKSSNSVNTPHTDTVKTTPTPPRPGTRPRSPTQLTGPVLAAHCDTSAQHNKLSDTHRPGARHCRPLAHRLKMSRQPLAQSLTMTTT